jgi:hypothetical protein
MPKEWPTDLAKVKGGGKALKGMFEKLETLEKQSKEKIEMETEILKIMEDLKIKKIRVDKDKVYEVKFLKSPSPHLELRRSKA